MVFLTQIGEGMLILGDQQQATSSFLEEQMFFGRAKSKLQWKHNTWLYSSNERLFLAHKVFGRRKIQT